MTLVVPPPAIARDANSRSEPLAPPPAAVAPPAAGPPAGTRAVYRAAADLRRGIPVLLHTGADWLVLVAAETAGEAGLAEFARLAATSPLLLLDAGRAEALGPPSPPGPAGPPGPPAAQGVVAYAAGVVLGDAAALRGLADPTAPQVHAGPPPLAPPPPGAAAALALAKLARLLPAMLAAPARPPGTGETSDVLRVCAERVLEQRAAVTGLERLAEVAVPLDGVPDARLVTFRAADGGPEHLAVLIGRPDAIPATAPAPLARIHSECFTGDLLGSLRCDCGPQLRGAIQRMAEEGTGVLLYLAQEGRGIGLVNKLRAYALQDAGLDTLDANRALGWGSDERDYLPAAAILRLLGIARVRLLTNNPQKLAALAAAGIAVERVSHLIAANGINDAYLAAKAARFGHLGA